MSGGEFFIVAATLLQGANAYEQASSQKAALRQQAVQKDIQANENMIARLRQTRSRLATQNVLVGAYGGGRGGSHTRRLFSASDRALRDIDRARRAEGGDYLRNAARRVSPGRAALFAAGSTYLGGKIAAGGLDDFWAFSETRRAGHTPTFAGKQIP